MNRHICLLYLSDKLSEQKYLEFYYRMSTALHLEISHMTQLSVLFSQYGLFQGKPVLKERIAPLKKIAAVPDCETLCKRAIYKSYNLLENACILCVFSSHYRNARAKEEKLLLRYLLRKEVTFYHIPFPQAVFHAMERIGPDYSIGTRPVLPFPLLLYSYLSSHDQDKFELDILVPDFIKYLYENTAISTYGLEYLDEIKERIRILLQELFQLPENMVNEDLFHHTLEKLNYVYEYEPVKFLQPVLVKPYTESEEKLIKDKPSSLEIEKVVETLKNEEKAPSPTASMEYQSDKESMVLNLESDISEQILELEEQEKINAGYIPSVFLMPKILRVTEKNSYTFVFTLQRSYHVAMECCTYEERKGLLIFASYNRTFFFYDLEVLGGTMLHFHLSDMETSFYTMHYIQLLAFFGDKWRDCYQIWDLSALFCLNIGFFTREAMEITQKTLNESCEENTDEYEYSMTRYSDIFSVLYKGAEEKNLLPLYFRIMHIHRILGKSYNLSKISPMLNPSFRECGLLSYCFKFDKNPAIRTPGMLYCIDILSEVKDVEPEANAFRFDALLLLEELPHSFYRKIYILHIDSKRILLFFHGERKSGSYFYDCYIRLLQRQYYYCYKKPMNTKSLVVNYTETEALTTEVARF